jgi:hypothetical protein
VSHSSWYLKANYFGALDIKKKLGLHSTTKIAESKNPEKKELKLLTVNIFAWMLKQFSVDDH